MLDMGKPQKLEELQTHVTDVRAQANFVDWFNILNQLNS